MVPGQKLCNQTWGEWKDAVGIGHYAHTCTYEEWVRLCACAALKRKRKKVNKLSVEIFLRRNGDDPLAFLPGFFPIANANDLGGTFLGKELPDVIKEKTGYRPCENTIRSWVEKTVEVGAYSRLACYSASQVEALLRHYVTVRVNASHRARERAIKRHSFGKESAA